MILVLWCPTRFGKPNAHFKFEEWYCSIPKKICNSWWSRVSVYLLNHNTSYSIIISSQAVYNERITLTISPQMSVNSHTRWSMASTLLQPPAHLFISMRSYFPPRLTLYFEPLDGFQKDEIHPVTHCSNVSTMFHPISSFNAPLL